MNNDFWVILGWFMVGIGGIGLLMFLATNPIGQSVGIASVILLLIYGDCPRL